MPCRDCHSLSTDGLFNMQDFGVLCPDPCVNTWEFYYPPLAFTGQFWRLGDLTLQTAHCACTNADALNDESHTVFFCTLLVQPCLTIDINGLLLSSCILGNM